jgi:dihydroneopterin aldolase
MMHITIEKLTFKTIIGLLDFERTTPQNIIVNCDILYPFENTKKDFINYAQVTEHIKTSMKKNEFLLIEDAILSLSCSLKYNFPTINTLTLKISKPDILDDCVVSLQKSFNF